jgi:hypothetical protein
MSTIQPNSQSRVLDVGVCNGTDRSSNFFEAWYPWPSRITAVSLEPVPLTPAAFPEVTFVEADGRRLPFSDQSFDIGFSNAVIEHTGTRSQQRDFAAELVRVCRQVFVATPNRLFPIDPHTLYPFIHWLPEGPRCALLTRLGRPGWASIDMLNPLSAGTLRWCFSEAPDLTIVRQRTALLTSNLIAIAGEKAPRVRNQRR